jgi:hypothetical protein
MRHMDDPDELVQVAERALANAEELLRAAATEANQRRVMSAWAFVRRARQAAGRKCDTSSSEPPTDSLR